MAVDACTICEGPVYVLKLNSNDGVMYAYCSDCIMSVEAQFRAKIDSAPQE
jgi:hypothetical protein